MKLKDILSPHFCEPAKPLAPLIQVAYDSDFCQDTVARGVLTADQMRHAANRYHLGKSRSGKCIYWMIDEMGIVRDGHLADTWVSLLLKKRYRETAQYIRPKHCLFGLHLVSQCASREETHPDPLIGRGFLNVSPLNCSMPVSIVESEQTAVILSELCPESLWMSYCINSNLTVDLLEPLQGHTVTIYPRTDPTMSNYLFFRDYAKVVRQANPSIRLTIDDTLEKNASPAQKSRSIDLLDFILDK